MQQAGGLEILRAGMQRMKQSVSTMFYTSSMMPDIGSGKIVPDSDNEIKNEIARFFLDLSFFFVYNATRYN